MPHDLPVALLEIWTAAFEAEARGRVFHQSEDRILFRGAIARRTASVRVTFLRLLAAKLGRPLPGNGSRHLASRAIADAWMGGARLLGDPVAPVPPRISGCASV